MGQVVFENGEPCSTTFHLLHHFGRGWVDGVWGLGFGVEGRGFGVEGRGLGRELRWAGLVGLEDLDHLDHLFW